MNFVNFLLGPFLVYLPTILMGSVLLGATVVYFFGKNFSYARVFKKLTFVAVSFKVLHAAILTVGQYYIWSKSSFTNLLLTSPLSDNVPLPAGLDKLPFLFQNPLGYFLFYSYGRFWLNVLISLAVAFAFYFFLRSLRQYKERFFVEGEVELGFITALTAGWPNFVIFLPLTLASVIIVSVFRTFFMRHKYTTLGAPLILGAVLTLAFGDNLVRILGLTVLKI